jgi:predicted ATP-grasp superfamily ATP-dependent carboligase
MIEFIKDTRDGVWKVIEVNGRPWLFVDFFRRAGHNYLGYLHGDVTDRREAWPDVKFPSAEVLTASPVHVALPTAFEPASATPAVGDVGAYLRSIAGERCLTFLDPADPAPGRAELSDLAKRYGIPDDALLAEVTSALSGR